MEHRYRYQRKLLPDERWWQLRIGGDRDTAARLCTKRRGVGRRPLVEALHVVCRLAGYRPEPMLAWLQKTHQRKGAVAGGAATTLSAAAPSTPASPRIRSHWQSLASQAEAELWSHSQFLYALCEQEVEYSQQGRQQRLLRAAHLHWSKALVYYDHGGRIGAGRWQELETLSRQREWLQRGENVLLLGPAVWARPIWLSESPWRRSAWISTAAAIPLRRWCRNCKRPAPTTACRKRWSSWIAISSC